MDLFSSSQRKIEDTVKKPLIYGDSDVNQERLRSQHKKQLKLFGVYLKNIYAKFDYKISKCCYTCISNSQNHKEIYQCEQKCGKGVEKFQTYVNERMEQMQKLLVECVSNGSLLPNAMGQIYGCYDKYNLSFRHLKKVITEESLYYQ